MKEPSKTPCKAAWGAMLSNLGPKPDCGLAATGKRHPPPTWMWRTGEENPSAKVSEETVLTIRRDNRPASQAAHEYGVRPRTFTQIRSRETWKHIS